MGGGSEKLGTKHQGETQKSLIVGSSPKNKTLSIWKLLAIRE